MGSVLNAVVFDWRGTLSVAPSEQSWVAEALRRLGRDNAPAAVQVVLDALAGARPERLEADGVDTSPSAHLDAYRTVFADARIDAELAASLYAVESDPGCSPFVLDAHAALERLSSRGLRIGVLSDIHVDIRPAFDAAGLTPFVDAFVLSFERGAQKPDPAFFAAVLADLGTSADETLMVGDRASHDGAAVGVGMTTLLVPPAATVEDRRLHLAEAVVVGSRIGAANAAEPA